MADQCASSLMSDGDDDEGDVIELVSQDDYDAPRAKLRASLSWLLSQVYGSNIPKEMLDPFYENSQGQLSLRPVLVNLMSSSELYCRACANMFPETHAQWSGHWSIIQVLSRKGIYISDTSESSVTETVLVQTAPFKLKAHIALIDALMRAYMCEVASVEKVVKAVRHFAKFPASTELPDTSEDALVFWVNKVCSVISREGVGACHKTKQLLEGNAGQKVLVTTNNTGTSSSQPINVPMLDDLMRDVGDGCSVAAVIAYYRPHLLNIQTVCLKESIGIADSLYNLRLIGQFCRSHLPWHRFHLSYEDLLYTHSSLHVNICTFLTDLFFFFEGAGSNLSNGSAVIMTAKEKLDATPAAGKRSTPSPAGSSTTMPSSPGSLSTTVNALPISNATKRSFQPRPASDETPGSISVSGGSSARGGAGPGSTSVSGGSSARGGAGLVSGSGNRRNDSSGVGMSSGALLANVSMDSNLNESFNADVSLSLALQEITSPRTGRDSALQPGHPDFMDVESLTSGQPSRFASPHTTARSTGRSSLVEGGGARDNFGGAGDVKEPLTPAVLRPVKERDTGGMSKAQERGDRSPRRKKVSSPTQMTSPQYHAQPHQRSAHATSSADDLTVSLSASSSETTVSPLSGEEGGVQVTTMGEDRNVNHAASQIHPRPHMAESLDFSMDLPNSARSNAGFSVAESYTIQDRPSTVQGAKAAGIPIVSESVASGNRNSREGSVASSGDYSDHESHKIHQDHKIRESSFHAERKISGSEPVSTSVASPPDFVDKPVLLTTQETLSPTPYSRGDNENNNSSKSFTQVIPPASPTPSSLSNITNFAALKRLKDNPDLHMEKMNNSGLIYMQCGSEPADSGSPDSKSSYLNKQAQGKTTFGQLSQTPSPGRDGGLSNSNSSDNVMTTSDPGSSELQQLRLKLEQKRKEIEKKKHRQDAQQNKMRQRLGKAAFMRVVSKHMDEGEEEEGEVTSTSQAPSVQAQLQARLGLNPAHRTQGGPATVPPAPNESAQRFTDWRSQSRASALSNPSVMKSNNSVSTGERQSSNNAFSRAGIQQTIDNVKNRWFNSGAGGDTTDLLVSQLDNKQDEEHDQTDSFNLHERDFTIGAAQSTPSPQKQQSKGVIRLGTFQCQTPLSQQRGGSVPREVMGSSPQLEQIPRRSSGGDMSGFNLNTQHHNDIQEYDSSLDKLNSSLTDLQGEIMRMSLQHEQQRNGGTDLSTIGSTAVGTVASPQTRPINGIPQQRPGFQTPGRQVPAPLSSAPYNVNQHYQEAGQTQPPPPMNTSTPQHSMLCGQQQHPMDTLSHNTSAAGQDGGFFVSLGEDASPKRPKPPKSNGERRNTPHAVNVHTPSKHSQQRPPSISPAVISTPPDSRIHPHNTLSASQHISDLSNPDLDLDPVVAAIVAHQQVAPLHPQSNEEAGGSPGVGFVIQDQTCVGTPVTAEDEMQRKKTRLMEMQRKRKEDQERKRLEKEAEVSRKAEERMLKDQEHEKRKAEEKVRREQIYQQYLEKKNEDHDHLDAPVKAVSKVKRRERSASNRPRPKSCFVKAATPEPGSMAGMDSCSSSQEDLTRGAAGGRSVTPGVMSAKRSAYSFRLPQNNRMRKAVSCNTLQGGAQSPGPHGASTFRRPPSPDLYRLKQRQRGNSQDSGSDNGSGSNPGSIGGPAEFSGPKLFVKPSAKSNRHIIVNAISHCCLAGSVNTDMKNKVLEEMSKCDANHFLILFRDAGCQYRGLFILYPETEEAVKVCGVGPRHITNKMCERFYKYNSGGKSFSEIASKKHLSVSVDAVVILNSLWKTGKAVVKR